MNQKTELPMGIENFARIRRDGFYYIDKTGLIKDLKENFYHGILLGLLWKLKYAENAHFDVACQKALKQIRDNHYEEVLVDDGMKTIYRYGIACYKKRCKVVSG